MSMFLELESELYEAWQRGDLEERFDVSGSHLETRSIGQSRGTLLRRRIPTAAVASGLLCVAAEQNHVEIIRFLAGRGADAGQQSLPCPLNVACTRGHLQSVRVLVELGAQPSSEMLQSALSNGFLDLAKYLVSLGVSIDTSQAEATLGTVCTKGYLETVRYVVGGLRIKPTMMTFCGACISRHSKVVLYLMTKGCKATTELLLKGDMYVNAVGDALMERVKVINGTAVAVWRKLSLAWINVQWFFHPSVTAHYVEIDVSDNNLQVIPIHLFTGELPFLRILTIHHNNITHLPKLDESRFTDSLDLKFENCHSETSDKSISAESQAGVSASR